LGYFASITYPKTVISALMKLCEKKKHKGKEKKKEKKRKRKKKVGRILGLCASLTHPEVVINFPSKN
jgi:hypothetical protein